VYGQRHMLPGVIVSSVRQMYEAAGPFSCLTFWASCVVVCHACKGNGQTTNWYSLPGSAKVSNLLRVTKILGLFAAVAGLVIPPGTPGAICNMAIVFPGDILACPACHQKLD
jgi:hypothetical protein